MQLEGVIPPVVTPVSSRSGEIDIEGVRSLTEFLSSSGVHGLFPTGTMGEFTSLTPQQRTNVIEAVVETASDRPVIAGCGGTSLESVKSNITRAERVGADAAVVVTPYYLDTSHSALCEFYEHVADEAGLPIVLYTIPQLTGIQLSPDSISRLAAHKNIIGLKDTSRDFAFFVTVTERTPDSFTLLMGSPELAIPAFDLDADGLVAASSNIVPEASVEMYEAFRAGERNRAISIFRTILLPLTTVTRSMPSVGAIKYLLQRRGHEVGEPLLPSPTLTNDDQQRLDECFEKLLSDTGVDSFEARSVPDR